MPSIIRLNKTQANSFEWVHGELLDKSLDFNLIQKIRFSITLHPTNISPHSMVNTYYQVIAYEFTGQYTLKFQIGEVGTGDPQKIPPDIYQVLFKYGMMWQATSEKPLAIGTSPTSYAVSSPLSALSVSKKLYLTPNVIISKLASKLNASYMNTKKILYNLKTLPVVSAISNVFLSPGGIPISYPSSVRPFVDGENMFPEIENLIRSAERWCYIGMWGLDEEMRLSADGPNDTKKPDIETLLKYQAQQIMKKKIVPDIKVLVWKATADYNYDGYWNNTGDISIVEVTWKNIRKLNGKQFISYMHKRGSCERTKLLVRLLGEYKKMKSLHDNSSVLFPSGIHVALQNHTTSPILGSHHQKFVITEKGCYIGGLNFYKNYWDTRRHLSVDARRDTSGRGLSIATGSVGGSGMSGPAGPLHDTGTILRGPAMKKVMRNFVTRWDQSISGTGGYDYLAERLESRGKKTPGGDRQKYNLLAKYLRLQKPFLSSKKHRYNTRADKKYTVDSAEVKVSLPGNTAWAPGGGVKEIANWYDVKLAGMDNPECFIYMENQYFTDRRITKVIEKRWRDNMFSEEDFAYFAIPYNPQTHWLDFFGLFQKNTILEKEMQNLKWLEIKTAKYILEKKNDQWIKRWKVDDARNDIKFLDGLVDKNPDKLKLDSKFRVQRPYKTDPAGNPLQQVPFKTFTVEEVMTESEIMSYTLATTDGQTPSVASEDAKYRKYLLDNGIYIHSKCSILLNEKEGGQHWATIGSANIIPRSLDDSGDQDSEMNVCWTQNKQIEDLFHDLWSEHLGESISRLEREKWRDKGWKNLEKIRRGGRPTCMLVRLDVVERYRHLK